MSGNPSAKIDVLDVSSEKDDVVEEVTMKYPMLKPNSVLKQEFQNLPVDERKEEKLENWNQVMMPLET